MAQKRRCSPDGQNLLDMLRRGVGDLTPKFGCGQGTCGTCTVLIDGEPHLSCLTLAEPAEGSGSRLRLASPPARRCTRCSRLHGQFRRPVRLLHAGHADRGQGAARRNPDPTREEVVEAISGNICRCTGYEPIINAILAAARARARA